MSVMLQFRQISQEIKAAFAHCCAETKYQQQTATSAILQVFKKKRNLIKTLFGLRPIVFFYYSNIISKAELLGQKTRHTPGHKLLC